MIKLKPGRSCVAGLHPPDELVQRCQTFLLMECPNQLSLLLGVESRITCTNSASIAQDHKFNPFAKARHLEEAGHDISASVKGKIEVKECIRVGNRKRRGLP